jgi:5'-deoxynucleotidase YfbR-like HD superfamily hydrolase
MLIGKHMADRGTMLYMGTMLCKALVHDLEEAVTGDVPRTFKYSSPETKAALDLGAAEAIKDIADRIFPFGSQVNAFADLWAKSKDTSIEGRIVAFADFLSVLSYLLQERIDHNQLILEHCSAMETHFKIYSDPSFDFIRDLVNEAGTLMQELFSKEVT